MCLAALLHAQSKRWAAWSRQVECSAGREHHGALTACVKRTAEECAGEEALLLAVDALSQAVQGLEQVYAQAPALAGEATAARALQTSIRLGGWHPEGAGLPLLLWSLATECLPLSTAAAIVALSVEQNRGWAESRCPGCLELPECDWQYQVDFCLKGHLYTAIWCAMWMMDLAEHIMPICRPLRQQSHAAAHQRCPKLQACYISVIVVGLEVHVPLQACHRACLMWALTSWRQTHRSLNLQCLGGS